MQSGAAQFEALGQASVALADAAGQQRSGSVGFGAEDERVVVEPRAEGGAVRPRLLTVVPQQLDGVGVQRDAATLPRLGALLPGTLARLRVAAFDGQHPCCEIYIAPPQRAQLTPAAPGDHGQPQQQTPLWILRRLAQQARGLGGRRWVGFAAFERRRLGDFGLVDREVAPAHRPVEGGAEDEVNLAHGVRGQRGAFVVSRAFPAAQVLAVPQPGVEALQELCVDFRRGRGAEGRFDVEPDQVLVALAGAVLVPRDLQPLLQHLRDRDVAARVPLLVDLLLQSGQRLLGLAVAAVGLLEVVLLARQRIDTGIDPDAEAVATFLDVAARAALTSRHGHQV